MRDNQDYKHRMATRTIRLLDQHGSPLRNQEVEIRQKKHEFLFACGAFDFLPLANGHIQGEDKLFMENRLNKWLNLFNAGTLPFYWAEFEPEMGRPRTKELMNLAKLLRNKGLLSRGIHFLGIPKHQHGF